MSIRYKITILFAGLTVIITLLLSIFIYLFTERYVVEDFLHRMEVRAGIAGKAIIEANEINVSFYNDIRENHLQRLTDETLYVFDTSQLNHYIDSLALVMPEGYKQTLVQNRFVRLKKEDVYFVVSSYEHQGKKYTVLLSAFNHQGEELLSDLRQNLIIGFVLANAIVIIAGLLLARQVINPIRHIISNARKITASNLHLRLQPKRSRDEIDDLAQTFNDMLDRLETSFETQSNFLNKAAHELRTPLTAIIGEAELALSKDRSAEEYSEALNVIAKEAEQLQHHTSSLLELAQAGYNSKEAFMSELRLDELLISVKRLIDFTEPDNQVHINFDELPESAEAMVISGNANLLKLAVANIVQNACKYSDQKPVYISLRATDEKHCEIIIQDEGIGIPENELKYIFDPFFRASNTATFRGYGVGLPLAQKIIRLHRGTLEYKSFVQKGTTVIITLPTDKI